MFPHLLLYLITLPDITFKLYFASKALKGIRAETAFGISVAISQLSNCNYKKCLSLKNRKDFWRNKIQV